MIPCPIICPRVKTSHWASSLAIPRILVLLVFGWGEVAGAVEPSTVPVLRIEAGMHTDNISRMSVDRVGHLVLTASRDRTARLWELPGGKLLRILRPPLGEGDEGKLFACALSPDGALAAVGAVTPVGEGDLETIYLFDTSTGQLRHRLSGLPTRACDLAFSKEGRFLAATLMEGGGLRVWEVASGREIARDMDYDGKDSGAVDWRNEEALVTACEDGHVRLYELATTNDGDPLRRVAKARIGAGGQPSAARFSPDGKRIAVGFADSNRVAVVDASSLFLLYAPGTADVDDCHLSSVVWSDDGTTLSAAGTWKSSAGNFLIRRWRDGGQAAARDSVATSDAIRDLRALPGGGLLFCSANPSWGVLSADGEISLLGASPAIESQAETDRLRLSADGWQVTFGFARKGGSPATFSLRKREVSLLKSDAGPASGLLLNTLEGTAGQNVRNRHFYDAPTFLRSSDVSRCMALTGDGRGMLLGCDKCLISCTFDERPKGWRVPTSNPVQAMSLSADDRLAVAAHTDGTLRWHRTDTGQEVLALYPHADRKRWVMWATESTYQHRTRLGARTYDREGAVVIREIDGRSPAAGSGLAKDDRLLSIDGIPLTNSAALVAAIQKHQPGDKVHIQFKRRGVLENDFTLDEDTEKLFVTKGVYYDCSPGAEDLIGWHVNRGKDQAADFFSAAPFREQFYRPDVIDRVLQTLDVAEAVRLANEARGEKGSDTRDAATVIAERRPPVVELEVAGAARKLEVPAGAASVTLRYKVRAGAAPITRMRVLLNGRPSMIDAPVPKDEATVATLTLPAPDGAATLAVIADTRLGSSEAATLQVVHAGDDKPATATARPRLFILAVGVNELRHKERAKDLQFAAKDAKDLVAAFKAQQGGVFEKVEARLLMNKDATAENILAGLDWLKVQTSASDLAIVSLSGHGGEGGDGRTYHLPYFQFLTHDFDGYGVEPMVGTKEIRSAIRSVRGKLLILLDACFSGSSLWHVGPSGDANGVKRLINELAGDGNGAVVFTSSSGGEVSRESAAWNNGVFTKAVLEGLAGKADPLGKGRVTVGNLEPYVIARVGELTKGEQTPCVVKPKSVPDFVIAVKTAVAKAPYAKKR